MQRADPVFCASSYWRQYQGPSLEFIAQHGIQGFRSGKFPQWSSIFAVQNPYVNRAEVVIAKLTSQNPRPVDSEVTQLLGHLVSLADRQYIQATWLCLHYCKQFDTAGIMNRISDAGIGEPSLSIVDAGRTYTLPFLRYCAYYLHLHARLAFYDTMNVLEVGGGYGGLCEVFRKASPNIRYVNVDLPVQTYLAQQYLSAVFPERVIPYSVTRAMQSIELSSLPAGSILTLCPWQLQKVRAEFEILLNTASFQEMSREQVKLYADFTSSFRTKYAFIVAIMEGIRSQPSREGYPYEPNPVKREHYLQFFNDYTVLEEGWPDFLPATSEANRICGSLLLRHRTLTPL